MDPRPCHALHEVEELNCALHLRRLLFVCTFHYRLLQQLLLQS